MNIPEKRYATSYNIDSNPVISFFTHIVPLFFRMKKAAPIFQRSLVGISSVLYASLESLYLS